MCISESEFGSSSSSQYCLVCCDKADGSHFGVAACRACAAFFRRTVQLEKKHTCLNDDQCSVVSNVRNMCRLCRFKKCISVGMQTSAVQSKRDQLGKRELLRSDKEVSVRKGHPIIDRIYQAYKALEEERKYVHDRKDNQAPRCISYIELKSVYMKDMSIVYKFLCNAFPGYAECSPDTKRAMFKNFFLPFTLLESGYMGYINDKPDFMIIPSGDYVDVLNIDTYFNEINNVFSKEATKVLFTQQFKGIKTSLISPMKAEKIEIIEFLFLVALLLWERDVEIEYDKSLNCEEIVRKRADLVQDLRNHYKMTNKHADPILRIGTVFTILPLVQRVSLRFQGYVEMKDLFDVYSLPRNLYDMFTPTNT